MSVNLFSKSSDNRSASGLVTGTTVINLAENEETSYYLEDNLLIIFDDELARNKWDEDDPDYD